MIGSDTTAALVLVGRDTLARRLAELLQQSEMQVFDRIERLPAGVSLDLVITDQPELPELADLLSASIVGGDVGIIVLGNRQQAKGLARADVTLPEDANDRELLLACRLLAENVRLRRQLRTTARQQQELTELAHTDSLTGLFNRRAWEEALSSRWERACLSGQPMCVAVFDVDHFKRVNDTHGHMVGDRLLQVVGRALRRGVRQGDVVARLGGDEFGLVLSDIDHQAVPAVIERLRCSLATALKDESLPRTTCSAGYSMGYGDQRPDAAARLFAAADQALHQAKREGRDRAVMSEN
jgi:diguanylate cyclase (GGDEF)-like protein